MPPSTVILNFIRENDLKIKNKLHAGYLGSIIYPTKPSAALKICCNTKKKIANLNQCSSQELS
jgi:hypothetical protein